MKTAGLDGAELDYWVARANGWKRADFGSKQNALNDSGKWWSKRDDVVLTYEVEEYQPSSDWAYGGLIIEREKIELFYGAGAIERSRWEARHAQAGFVFIKGGPTPLVAAMRAYVQSKFGDEVHDYYF